MKCVLVALFVSLATVQSSVAYTTTNSPIGAWRFSSKARMSSSTAWYASSTGELAGVTFDGYVTYGPEAAGWFLDGAGGDFKVFETWVRSDADVTVWIRSGGDDGHSVFVDGEFLAGGAMGETLNLAVEMDAGHSRHVLLTSNNALGGWHVNCRARTSETNDYVVLEDIPGLSIHAEGVFPALPPDGPVAHYPLDGNAEDASGNGFDGVVNGAVLTEDRYGNPEAAYLFDGVDDHIVLPSVVERYDTMSIVAWVNSGEDSARVCAAVSKPRAPDGTAVAVGVGNARARTVFVREAGAVDDMASLRGGSVPSNEWHMLATVVDIDEIQLYVDGVMVSNAQFRAGAATSTQEMLIGRELHQDGQGTDRRPFHGAIDDVRIYDRALTAAEIAELHHGGGPVAYYPLDGSAEDTSGNGFHGVVHGAVLALDRFGNENGAYAFDGDDYIETPSLGLNTSVGVTLAGWARLNDVGARQGIMGALANVPAGSYPIVTDPWNRHYLGVREGNYHTGAGNTQKHSVEAAGISDGVWFFFAVTMEGSNAVYYVNGNAVDSMAYDARGVCNLATHIGAINDRGSASSFLEGAVDDVRIYDRALSAAEVEALHDASGEGPDLLLYCDFDENVEDQSGNGTHGALQGAPGWVQGVDGSAIEMSGGSSWVEFPRAPLNPRDDPMSFSVWVCMSQTPTSEYQNLFIIANALNEHIGGAIWSQITSDGTGRNLRFGMRSDIPGSQVSCTPSDVFSDGRWHHLVAIRRSMSVLEMWVDGELESTIENGQLGDVDVEARDSYGQLDPDIPAFLGYSPRGRWFDGKVDELRIYSGALTPAAVVELYQDGTNGIPQPESVDFVVSATPSEYGVSSPHGYGSNSVVLGSVVTETVSSPVMDGDSVRYVCTGWVGGTGSIPVSGESNTVDFIISTDSSLTWQWERQVKLSLTGNAGGVPCAGGEWFATGTHAELVADVSDGYAFIGWQGDIPGHYSTENPLTVTMDEPRSVKALFWHTSTELGRHWIEGGTYFPGMNRIECRFYVPDVDDLLSLVWNLELPAGWSLVTAHGEGGPLVVGDYIVFTQNHVSNPIRFCCIVSAPSGMPADVELSAVATYQASGMANPKGLQVVPEPLVLSMHGSGFHSADYQDLPWVIDAHELNRVLSYWRAGHYRPDPEGLDGFVATTERYRAPFENGHSADFRPGNWRINAREANRVLAYWRAGGYRINCFGADGFAPVRYASGTASLNSIASAASGDPIEVQAAGGGYDPGGTVVVTSTVSFASSLLALAIRPDLPDGWTLQHVQAPANPEWTDTEILWTGTLPSSPVTVVMTINVPVTSRGDRTVEGIVDAYEDSATNSSEVAVPPVELEMDATDGDGDGLPDAWEAAYTSDSQGLDPNVDSDKDGLTNWKEWYAGTNPTNSESRLVVSEVDVSGATPILSWQSAQDRTYSVLYGSNLVDGMTVLTSGIESTPPTNSMALPSSWPGQMFFRVKVE